MDGLMCPVNCHPRGFGDVARLVGTHQFTGPSGGGPKRPAIRNYRTTNLLQRFSSAENLCPPMATRGPNAAYDDMTVRTRIRIFLQNTGEPDRAITVEDPTSERT